jgi:hypothetical protein
MTDLFVLFDFIRGIFLFFTLTESEVSTNNLDVLVISRSVSSLLSRRLSCKDSVSVSDNSSGGGGTD